MTIIVAKSRESLLTTSSGYTNYRGILNLSIILLVLSNARAALENIIKYGILVDPLSWFAFLIQGSKHWPALVIVLNLATHIFISYLIELIVVTLEKRRRQQQQQQQQQERRPNQGQSHSPKHKQVPPPPPPPTHKSQHSIKHHHHHHHHQQQKLSDQLSLGHHEQIFANATIVANLLACISIPPIVIYAHDTHPISTSGSLMLVSIVFLKLVSYHMMNFWCRDLKRASDCQSCTTKFFLRSYTPPVLEFAAETKKKTDDADGGGGGADQQPAVGATKIKTKTNAINNSQLLNNHNQRSATKNDHHDDDDEEKLRHRELVALEVLGEYPRNINLADIWSFMMFPTLNYEVQFARSQRIRKRFLIKRCVELLILSQLDLALVQQWIVPTVSNSVTPFRQMQFSHMLERLLKLAIPNHVIWLIWFYLFFHSLLNIAAELTRFADREFYRDWWNSESVYYFWSNWNIPVHKWCARHLYLPLISLGLNKCQASTAVFFVSAFFHEYLVSVPLKMFRMWAFTGMLIQLPWARFVSSYFNHQLANFAVWVSLIIGQPLCILMYYHDYYVINNVQPAIKIS